MFRIEDAGPKRGSRLLCDTQLSAADFDAIASRLGEPPFRARKTGLVSARRAVREERIDTTWNGKESRDTAAPGDYVVTSLDPAGAVLRDRAGQINVYVIRTDRFGELYEPVTIGEGNSGVWRPRGVVRAIYLPGGFEILAPWGEIQRAAVGYLLDNGREVYGNAKETFEATYERA